jgi:hypothetical protein
MMAADMNKKEHVTALFIGALFYHYKGDKQMAQMLIETAVDIHKSYPFKVVGIA